LFCFPFEEFIKRLFSFFLSLNFTTQNIETGKDKSCPITGCCSQHEDLPGKPVQVDRELIFMPEPVKVLSTAI